MESHIQAGHAALQGLEESNFDERAEAKRNFEQLYKVFLKFKQTPIESAADSPLLGWLKLMMKTIDYVQTAQYNNYFKEFDKKLTKNILKRCVVEPFAERIMQKVTTEEGDNETGLGEIRLFEHDESTIQQLNEVLKGLLKMNGVQGLTGNLKDWLSVPLV